MEPINLYNSPGYRAYLQSWLKAQEKSHGLRSEMCAAMNCQNAHLTRALREEVHLTMDQAFRATIFLKLNKAESAFFLKLVEHDRAGDPLYRKQLKEEMAQIKSDQENLAKRFQQDQIGNLEKEMTYYSSWHWIALHYITEIKQYQKAGAIADRLGLHEQFVRRGLEILESYQLVKRQGDSWSLNSGSIHLPKTSPLNSVQHGNWRSRAVLKSQDTADDGVHFTVVQTLSHEDFEKIKQLILSTIDQYRKIAKPSNPEELICFTCDFFRA